MVEHLKCLTLIQSFWRIIAIHQWTAMMLIAVLKMEEGDEIVYDPVC